MSFAVEFNSKSAKRFLDDVHNAAVDKAMPSTINKTTAKLKTLIKRDVAKRTGISSREVGAAITQKKAYRGSLYGSVTVRSRTVNAIRFSAKRTKTALTHRAYKRLNRVPSGFIGNSGRTAFKRKGNGQGIEPVYGPNIARAVGGGNNLSQFKKFVQRELGVQFAAQYKYYAGRVKRSRR